MHRLEYRTQRKTPAAAVIMHHLVSELFPEWKTRFDDVLKRRCVHEYQGILLFFPVQSNRGLAADTASPIRINVFPGKDRQESPGVFRLCAKSLLPLYEL